MIEPRVYRAAFVPAILAFVLAMFSLEAQPAGTQPDLAADVLFQGDAAAEEAERIVRRAPDRAPGSDGNAVVAELVGSRFEAAGLDVEVDEFSESGRDLQNVVGTRVGSDRRRIVVAAARDSAEPPDLAGSAADTATLLRIASALEGRAPEKTIVLASLDGSTLGDAGARRFAETAADGELIEAVLVLSSSGAGSEGGPGLVAWSNDEGRGSVGLERTARESLDRELEGVAGEEAFHTELAHLAVPVGVGAQGILLDRGIEAIRFSGTGMLPADPQEEINPNRLGALGRATLGTLSAIDASDGLVHGPGSYVTVGRNVLPDWAIAILSLTLIIPALVASVDAFARARRHREPVASWMWWVVARVVPFAVGLLAAILLVVAGLAPNALGSAPAPSHEPLDATAAALLGVAAAAAALAWIFLRPLLSRWGRAPGDPSAPGAGCAVALVTSVAVLALWVVNPWAALALVPAAHLWALAALAPAAGRTRLRWLLVAGGLLVPAAIALLHALRLSLDPLEGAWYVFLLVTGGQVNLATAIVGCVLLGALASLIEILLAGRRVAVEAEEKKAPGPAVRGPGGYAGPGSLGGTESALKR